jgi:hypothetical protein
MRLERGRKRERQKLKRKGGSKVIHKQVSWKTKRRKIYKINNLKEPR